VVQAFALVVVRFHPLPLTNSIAMNTKTAKAQEKDNTTKYALIAFAAIAVISTVACLLFSSSLY